MTVAITVTNTNDHGDGSLRQAILDATAGETIEFDPSLKGKTITLTSGQLMLYQDVTIIGDVDNDGKADITISGDANHSGTANSGDSRIFLINYAGTDVELDSLTLTGGYSYVGGAIAAYNGTSLTLINSTISGNTASAGAGGIFMLPNTVLTVENSTISGNAAPIGGGLVIEGTATLTNVTMTGNTATGHDGGAIETTQATVTILDSTIVGNTAHQYGGGINLAVASSLTISNSVVANNTASTGPDIGDTTGNNTIVAGYDFFGTDVSGIAGFTSNGSNFLNAGDPRLGPLGDHGGPVKTMVPLANSPLVDAGLAGLLPTDALDIDHDGNYDERLPLDANGKPRVQGALDIGAVEVGGPVVTTNSDTGVDKVIGTSFAADVADGSGLSLREALAWAAQGDTITFASSLKGQTIRLIGGQLNLTRDVTIDGDVNGDHKADITISGDANNSGTANAGDSRIFNVGNDLDVGLASLTLTNGYTTGSGGAMYVGAGTTLLLADSTITRSVAGLGGAIATKGDLFIGNSTIANNSAGSGGGIDITATGTATIVNATITGNTATYFGGGIETNTSILYIHSSTIVGNHSGGYSGGIDLFHGSLSNIFNTVVAGNTAASGPPDVGDSGGGYNALLVAASFFGTDVSGLPHFTDNGGNINNGGNPLLGPLGDHGGSVKTMDILNGSPLIDGGDASWLPVDLLDVDHDGNTAERLPVDANGNPRTQGVLDIGATQFVAEPQFFISGDFNGDGIDDIAWRNRSSGYVSAWLMDKNAHRHAVHPSNATSDWEALSPGDYNGDGIDDIAWRNTSSGYVSVWLMDKNGNRHAVHSGDASSAWQALAPGDFNGDGITDIAWRNSSTGYVSVWLMDSNGHRHVVHSGDATSAWQALAPGDYNGDGITDIAWRNTSTGYVSVWLMDSNGHRHVVHPSDATRGWEALAPGDYNGDGITDIAWRNTATGYVSLWLMDKNGHRHAVHSGDAGGGWQALGSGDYNGDGIDDMAWRNTATGYVSVWLMDKNGKRHFVHSGDATADWQALSPGDYNGDGITDIAWRNTSTGYVSVWQMDKNAHRHVVHPSDATNIWQAV